MAATVTTKELKARRVDAAKERATIQPLLDEAFKYAIPYRKPVADGQTGESRVDQVFDHTAIDAAFRFAGKLQQDFWPVGQENYALSPGPVAELAGVPDEFRTELESISKITSAFFLDGAWDQAFHEMALELSAGTGAILMNGTSDPGKLWEPISVPIGELLLQPGPNNQIDGIFWTRNISPRVIERTWPSGSFGEDFKKLLKDKPDEKIAVHHDCVWVTEGRRWHTVVWWEKQVSAFHRGRSRTNPWLTPRYFRVPGETMGRGPVMLAMPTIKTVNTAKRLQLMAAAIAMLGIYTAVDDGVFNPDNSPLEPGVFWKVARNQGSALGPSVSRFPDPRLDLSALVIENMQMAIKSTMMDQALPVESAAIRSATEIFERVKRLASDHIGASGRLIMEIVVPAVKRVIELAYERGLTSRTVDIDQLLIKVQVKSPLALSSEAQRIEKVLNWLQMVIQTTTALGAPGAAAQIAEVANALEQIGRDMGVPSEFIISEEKRTKMIEQEAERQAAETAAAALVEGGGGVAV
jgi:head-to-tail connecting protein